MKYLDILRNRPIVEKIGVFGILSSILWAVMANELDYSYNGSISYQDWGITLVIQFVILIIVFGGKPTD